MSQRGMFQQVELVAAQSLFMREDLLVFDVRDPKAFRKGHIPGARNVSITNLSSVINWAPKSMPVLIYCYHGFASQEYAQIFTDFRFQEVYSLSGGYEAWRKQVGGPTQALQDGFREWLVAHGFPDDRVQSTTGKGTTPLMRASRTGRIDLVRVLIAMGALLDARNADGNNALWLACVGGHADVIDLLIEAGIDIDNVNVNRATALMYSASSGRADAVRRLIAAGADLAKQTLDGRTALDLASTADCLTLLRSAAETKRPPREGQADAGTRPLIALRT